MSFPKGFGEVQSTIERWLKEEGFTCSQLSDPNTLFNYAVTLPSGTHVNILQPSSKKDSILVSTRLLFTSEQRKLFGQKSRTEREEILSEMRFKLASVDVEFAFEDGELPKAIRFDHPIYYDALAKDRFFKSITTVYKAFKLAGWIFTQSL